MSKTKRVRLDVRVAELGLAASRDRAQRLILAGQVLVDDVVVDKAGTKIRSDASVRVRGQDHPYVGRGGLKMEGALADLAVNPGGLRCLDVGASTGGFTDCLLQRGAAHVVAVDVGTNQLAYKLRVDPRVSVHEQTDIRAMTRELLAGSIDLAVVDASFISLRLLLEPLASLLDGGARVLALVKPQFEVGRDRVGKGGVVRDDTDRLAAVDAVVAVALELGFAESGRADSRVAGAKKGNREVFVLFERLADRTA